VTILGISGILKFRLLLTRIFVKIGTIEEKLLSNNFENMISIIGEHL